MIAMVVALALAQVGDAELSARTVRIESAVTLEAALKSLQDGTGNTVVDRRSQRTNPRLELKLKGATFWQALDAIVAAAGCGYSVYQEDGKVALIDTPLRRTRVAYDGIFRTSVKRVTTSRDIDSGTHLCLMTLEIAWEPRFQPFLLNVGTSSADFGAGVPPARSTGQGEVNVTGRTAFEFEARLTAPPRSTPAIVSLEGSLSLLGPTRMLTFDFADPKPGQMQSAEKDGVRVRVLPGKIQPKRWSFDVTVDNPPEVPRLESFQQDIWLGNNHIQLRGLQGDKSVTLVPPGSEREDLEVSVRRAQIRYHFTQVPTALSMATLSYRTPGRIVAVPARFALKDIPLP